MKNNTILRELGTDDKQVIIHKPSSPVKIFATLDRLIQLSEEIMREESEFVRQPSSKISKFRIMVAEDNKINQIVISSILENLGYSFVMVNDGKEALTEYQSSPVHYDIILMDCEMPILNGYQASSGIREWEKQYNIPHIPIVAVTAHAQEEFEEKSKLSGMNDYITKPINLSSISKCLEKWLDI